MSGCTKVSKPGYNGGARPRSAETAVGGESIFSPPAIMCQVYQLVTDSFA